MARLYPLLFLVTLVGGVGYASMVTIQAQQRIQTLAENNAKLEVAIEKVKSINH